jgi:Metallo-beta-lactamase superfamily
VDLIQLMPRLYFIRFPVGHAYLWHDPDGLTLIDAGLPGSAPLIADAIRQSGYQPADLRRVVLTHFHADHIGAAAAIADWGDVEVLAHHADTPFIRAAAAGPAPDLADWEQPIYEQVMSQLPEEPVIPPQIDRAQAAASFRRLAGLSVAVACFGHGEPLTRDAATALEAAARNLPADADQHVRDTPGIGRDPSRPVDRNRPERGIQQQKLSR